MPLMIHLSDQQAELVCGGSLVNVNVNVPIQNSVGIQNNLANSVAVAALGGVASNSTAQGNFSGVIQAALAKAG